MDERTDGRSERTPRPRFLPSIILCCFVKRKMNVRGACHHIIYLHLWLLSVWKCTIRCVCVCMFAVFRFYWELMCLCGCWGMGDMIVALVWLMEFKMIFVDTKPRLKGTIQWKWNFADIIFYFLPIQFNLLWILKGNNRGPNLEPCRTVQKVFLFFKNVSVGKIIWKTNKNLIRSA